MADNLQVIKEWFDSWNKKDADRNAAFASENWSWLDIPSGKTFRGQSGAREYGMLWSTAFPDGQLEITNLFVSGDQFSVEFTLRATHSGVLGLADGSVWKPTGKKVELKFAQVGRVKNSKIEGGSNYYDVFFLLRRLGALEQAKAA
ncbi:MAG: ester cyclase [Bdellovibrionota bacterium]